MFGANMVNLVGLKYPVTDFENNVVGYRTIKSVYNLENKAGLGINLVPNSNSLIVISFPEAFDLVKSNESGQFDNLLEIA